MANPRRASTIRKNKDAMGTDFGPQITHYNTPLDTPYLYKWFVGDSSTTDGLTVLGHQGGTAGRWHLVRNPTLGADLVDGNEVLTVGQNFFRTLPAATLTGGSDKTLSTDNAASGDVIHILRLDTTANTVAIINSGPAAGTLFTLPASQAWWARSYFNGTDWVPHSAGQLP
jgi:hypothetical protein